MSPVARRLCARRALDSSTVEDEHEDEDEDESGASWMTASAGRAGGPGARTSGFLGMLLLLLCGAGAA